MEVKVRFFTSLREITGKREETLSFPEDAEVTIDLVLQSLREKHGASFTEYVFDPGNGEPRGFLQFLVNGQSTQTLNGLRTLLKNGDVLAILPPVGGG